MSSARELEFHRFTITRIRNFTHFNDYQKRSAFRESIADVQWYKVNNETSNRSPYQQAAYPTKQLLHLAVSDTGVRVGDWWDGSLTRSTGAQNIDGFVGAAALVQCRPPPSFIHIHAEPAEQWASASKMVLRLAAIRASKLVLPLAGRCKGWCIMRLASITISTTMPASFKMLWRQKSISVTAPWTAVLRCLDKLDEWFH